MTYADSSFGQMMEATMWKLKNAWRPVVAVALLSLLVGCNTHHMQQSQATATPNNRFMMMQTTAGSVLSTPTGMTLYTYDKDVMGKSDCYGECAQYWPPFLGDSSSVQAGFMTLVPRTDGTMQWAANGKPLYTFIQDKKPGEVKGDNFHNVWHVVR
jgi:predicted lipoprotein with Yx(FWY)xxD motif